MRFALMTEPQQGLTYDEIRAVARAAEEAGFETYLRSDHYASFPGEEGQHTTDAWATLAGLARDTSRIRLGTLVSPVTFRVPGPFAKLVTTVDEMSGGRVEVGVGAGWNELEHAQLGIPFPGVRERYDMLEETLAILHGLWTEPDGWTFDGAHWSVRGSLFRPRPGSGGRRHPHLITGGDGKSRGLSLAARFSDEYNLSSARPERCREVYGALDEACREHGRDPGSIVRSAMTGVLVAESEGDLRDRVRQQLEVLGSTGEDGERWLNERRSRWVMGTPDEALERIAAFADAGAERLALQDFMPRDLDMVRLLGERVLPAA